MALDPVDLFLRNLPAILRKGIRNHLDQVVGRERIGVIALHREKRVGGKELLAVPSGTLHRLHQLGTKIGRAVIYRFVVAIQHLPVQVDIVAACPWNRLPGDSEGIVGRIVVADCRIQAVGTEQATRFHAGTSTPVSLLVHRDDHEVIDHARLRGSRPDLRGEGERNRPAFRLVEVDEGVIILCAAPAVAYLVGSGILHRAEAPRQRRLGNAVRHFQASGNGEGATLDNLHIRGIQFLCAPVGRCQLVVLAHTGLGIQSPGATIAVAGTGKRHSFPCWNHLRAGELLVGTSALQGIGDLVMLIVAIGVLVPGKRDLPCQIGGGGEVLDIGDLRKIGFKGHCVADNRLAFGSVLVDKAQSV